MIYLHNTNTLTFLSPIATCKAVINSAFSLSKFSDKYESSIVNFFCEFDLFKDQIKKKNINLINYYNFNFSKYLPYQGFIKSRLSFVIFFVFGFYPLIKTLKIKKPDYFVIHLISSLPLLVLILFKFETRFILRISGYPRLNFFRKFLWKLAFKKIYYVTCPTKNTYEYLKMLDILEESKLKILYDPVINLKEITKKNKELVDFENYYLSVGRLTNQKNFLFLCKAFKELKKKKPNIKLLIAGNGEQEKEILNFIKKNKLEKNIILLGYQENIFPYLKKAKGFILSSLWEDPGFVLIEAGFCRTPVLSSDAWPGPIEIIKDNLNGFIYRNNDIQDFIKGFHKLDNSNDLKKLIYNNLKNTKKFTLYDHYKKFNKIL
jgi:glycosyltransferase involved in cell wall biosynthesis